MFHARLDAARGTALTLPPLADRRFLLADQERFTALSGDRSPIHLMSYAGRPGFPDRPVVHGVHALLWGLDALFDQRHDLPPIATLKVRFEKPVHVGDAVGAVLVQRDDRKLRLNLARDGERVASIHLGFGMPRDGARAVAKTLVLPDEPRLWSFDEIAGFAGRVPFTAVRKTLAGQFPRVTQGLGEQRVVALVCSSVVVGMVCPGFHALYAGLDLAATAGESDDALQVEVSTCDERFHRVVLAVEGGGWAGVLDTLYRPR